MNTHTLLFTSLNKRNLEPVGPDLEGGGKKSGQPAVRKRQRGEKSRAQNHDLEERQGLVGNRTFNTDEQNHMPSGHEFGS